MKRIINILAVFAILTVFFTGCDNFLNSNDDFNKLLETDIDYAKAPLVNIFVGHNNDDFGTVGTGVVNYSVTAKVGYAFEVSFALKASAGNFVGWNAYTKYDPDIPANCKQLDESYIEFVDNSRGKLNAKVKILKKIDEQIRLVPEVSAFPVMEVCLPSEFTGISPSPASFNPPQAVKALTPGQEYSITATTTVDYGFSENPDECWKVYRKDSLGNEIEIADGSNITISKNTGTQLANGRSQSTIYITVEEDFSGRFYVSPKLITYPSMKVEIENFDSSLVKMSHSGTVSMAKGTPYEITLQTDPSVGFSGWKLCKRDNINLAETEELIPADNKTTTNINLFTAYSDDYITVSSPSYEVSETGKTAGKVNASIRVTLKQDMDDLDYSYYLLPQFFKYPVVNVYGPDGYASAGRFSLTGAGYLDNDSVRMMMNDYEYTITYKTTEDYSFADPYWIVYETADPSKNLLDESDSKIELTESSIVVDESGTSTCSVSVILKHNFGTTLNIKPVVAQKPSMNISFEEGTPNGINLSLGGSTITSGSVNSKIIKMSTGKTYTATVNVPKGYSFEGWRLVRETSSSDKVNWITETTKTTTDIVESATIDFDSGVSSENPADYVRVFNAKYTFESEGRNAGTTKATVDISFKKELSDFSLNLIPVIKAVPEISFVAVNSDYGNLLPAASDVRNLYPETKIELMFKSTKQATAGKEIWKIKKWDSETGSYSINYSANVGYTSQDLTAALKDSELITKDIIIYNNDNEAEVQPNSKGEYITTKTAVLYVNRMPEANLQLYVEPEVYNTIKFVPGDNFEATAYDNPVIIPAGKDFDFTIKTKAGYEFKSLGTIVNDISVPDDLSQTTSYDGVSTVTGTITSKKNNGVAVVVTPEAEQIYKLYFGKPVLSTLVEKEDAGTMIPADTDFIYQVVGNSTSIRFETTGEYTFEGFGAISEKQTSVLNNFLDIYDPKASKYYVFTSGTLAQAKDKVPKAKLIIHDLVETDLTDSQGQAKKRVTGTLTVVEERKSNYTIKPVVKAKPSFAISLDNAEKGSVSPSTAKAILINEDYNISYISSSGYGFEKWSVTEDDTVVPVLTLDEAKGTAGTSATSFVVDLGSVQELTGANTVENVKTALGSNSSKLLAVIYNSSKVESQATEGVETATAKFRIVKDINSAIVVTPVIYKHSYFYLHLKNSADGRFSPISRTLMKAGKDYDFEFVFNEDVYTINEYSLNSASTFSSGTAYGTSACAQLSDLPISNWSDYESKKFVIYDDTISVNESNNVVTRKGKIRLIKEQTDGVEIHIRPSVFSHNKISLEADTENVSKLQINNTISTTGSINSYTMIDHKLIPCKSYSISATPVSGKAIYENPEKMWILSNDYSDDLYDYYGSFEFTNGNYTDCDGQEAVFYNCRLEYVGDNLYKACADVIINSDEVQGFTIKPNVYTMPVFNFNSPALLDGTKKGTCFVNGSVPQTDSKMKLGTEYIFAYEAEDGNHISSLELYDGSGNLKKTFGKTDSSYTADSNLKITGISFSSDMRKITGKITFLKETVTGYSFQCTASKGKPGPVLNIGTGYSSKKTYVEYNDIYYLYGSDASGITQINSDVGISGIYAAQEFDLEEAQSYGYQGEAEREDVGYHIAKEDSIKFYVNATGMDSTHLPSKVKITERLMYLHPGMVFDYSPEHDYSQYDVIGTGGLQLYDENGNYLADSKYKTAGFKFEETTTVNVKSLSGYSKSGNTISGNIAYTNKISYGGIHQYTVSVLDNDGNESNKFVVYLDVPRTPRSSAEIDEISGCASDDLFSEGLSIEWSESTYPKGTEPLNENKRIVYSAGRMQSSTTESVWRNRYYETYLRMFPSNSTFKFKFCLSDSNGYATEFKESTEFTSQKVYEGDLVVRDPDTFKFYYIKVDEYLRNKNKLEPVAVIVARARAGDRHIIGAGLYDVGDYPFTNSKIWFNASNSVNTNSTDGKVMLNTWKTNAPYYSATPRTESNRTVLFTEPNFPAIFKATHYGDVYKTVSGQLCNGWYLPGRSEILPITYSNSLIRINRTLRLIDGQTFEYNSDYWSADYTEPDSGGPRCKTLCTPEDENSTTQRDGGEGLIYSTEIHHVRAVFDFTDLAEPWPNN